MDNICVIIDKPSNQFLGMALKFQSMREDEINSLETYKFASYTEDIKTFLGSSLLELLCEVRKKYLNAIMLDFTERETALGYVHSIRLKERL